MSEMTEYHTTVYYRQALKIAQYKIVARSEDDAQEIARLLFQKDHHHTNVIEKVEVSGA